MPKLLSKKKAKIMLKEGKVRGKKLTRKQKGLFGLIAGGAVPTRLNSGRKKMGRKKK